MTDNDVFVYDPKIDKQPQRPWNLFVGKYSECQWNKIIGFCFNNITIIEHGIIIAHFSRIAAFGITKPLIEKYCLDNPFVTVVVISAGERQWNSNLSNLYFRRTPVSYEDGDSFSTYFSRFLEQIKDTHKPNFVLLEPAILDSSNLISLAVLCKGYAAAGIANKEISANDPLAIEIGWHHLTDNKISQISEKLKSIWPMMKGMPWWRNRLGIIDTNQNSIDIIKYRFFLVKLIQELGLIDIANLTFNLRKGEHMINLPTYELLAFLENTPDVCNIAKLLKATQIEKLAVEKAYRQIKTFLEQR